MRSILSALALLLTPLVGWAADRPTLAEVLALQQLVQETIERAEPAIACILVSRSDAYARQWNQGPEDAERGLLGAFDSHLLLARLIGADDLSEKQRRFIRDHDLSLAETVPESYGSGVVLDAKKRLVLTNAHVVRGASKIYVRLPGLGGSWANIYAADPRSDLAVLKLISPLAKPLHEIPLGTGERPRKGQFVLGLAHPFAAGFRDGSPSASWGMISNVRRRLPGNANELDRARRTLHHYGDLIETDVRLNVGCSGGALLDLEGRLVGLTTAQAAITGSEGPGGYAIPITDSLKQIIARLCEGKEVEYGFLGVSVRPGQEPGGGVQLAEVVPGSPAWQAGLKKDDYILAVDNNPIREPDDLFLHIGKHVAGSRINLVIARDPLGAKRRVGPVKLAKLYVPGDIIAFHQPPAPAGLRVDHLSILGQKIRLPRWQVVLKSGVVIRSVKRNSPAARARLQEDQVITHVNGIEVNTPEDFYREMQKAGPRIRLTLADHRGRPEYVDLE
jgi:serine protease Do